MITSVKEAASQSRHWLQVHLMLQMTNFSTSLFPLSEFPEDNRILPSFAGEG